MYTVHDNHDSKTMGFINEVFEVIRGALSGADGEKVGYMVAEGGVVGVLFYCH